MAALPYRPLWVIAVIIAIGLAAYGYQSSRTNLPDIVILQNEQPTPPAAEGTQTPINTAGETVAADCPDSLTPSQTEGPYYKAGSPQRTSLREQGIPGDPIVVTGYVFDEQCQPVARAWLDFWQADGSGRYDNTRYMLRGHQFTDEHGRYSLETVKPGEYPGRTPHIHVKLRAPEASVITSQLYFSDQESNTSDSIFNEALVVTQKQRGAATFNFKIATDG